VKVKENSESTFHPHSDEELARLLEDQMRAMRMVQPITSPQPATSQLIVREVEEPVIEPPSNSPLEEELGIDALFGALLDNSQEIAVVTEASSEDFLREEEVTEEADVEVFIPSVEDLSLELTQPLAFIQEDIIVAEVSTLVVDTDEVTEELEDDVHQVAERILAEISIDGEIFATTFSATAGLDPIPQMFGEPENKLAQAEAPAQLSSSTFSESLAEVVTEVAVEQESILVQPHAFSTNPVHTFASRPSFDELVFGTNSEH
jgi:hypothetical protein